MKKGKMSKRGKQTKAGLILTGIIRDIAEEPTEFLKGKDGSEDRMVTKAEALARMIWLRALGYTEKKVNGKGDDVEVTHAPDRVYVGMILDRMEGRVPQSLVEGDEKLTAADKVSEQGKSRIAKAGGIKKKGKK